MYSWKYREIWCFTHLTLKRLDASMTLVLDLEDNLEDVFVYQKLRVLHHVAVQKL